MRRNTANPSMPATRRSRHDEASRPLPSASTSALRACVPWPWMPPAGSPLMRPRGLPTSPPTTGIPKVGAPPSSGHLDQVLGAVDPAAVTRLCVDGTSGTVLAVDASGQPLAEPLMYDDPVRDAGILALIARLAPRDERRPRRNLRLGQGPGVRPPARGGPCDAPGRLDRQPPERSPRSIG